MNTKKALYLGVAAIALAVVMSPAPLRAQQAASAGEHRQ